MFFPLVSNCHIDSSIVSSLSIKAGLFASHSVVLVIILANVCIHEYDYKARFGYNENA